MADTEQIEGSIAFLKRKIKSTRQAIGGLRKQVSEHNSLISAGGGDYDMESLKQANAHAEKQITGLDQEIATAKEQISDLRGQIEFIEKTAAIAEGVTIDASAE